MAPGPSVGALGRLVLLASTPASGTAARDARLRVVRGARHSLASEAPETVAGDMDHFLGGA